VEEREERLLSGRTRALVVVASAELFVLTIWFSGTVVGPQLATAWHLSGLETVWLTNAVQLGFVVGALVSATLTLADVVEPRFLFAGSAFAGAAATALIAAAVHSALPAIALRFATGVTLAGVYPTGMKMLAGWFERGRGLAIGVLVGALAVGSGGPDLLRAIGGVHHPTFVLYGTAALAVVGGVLVLSVDEGPYQPDPAPFDPRAVRRIVADRGVVLAYAGYFGHMWELYAVWAWIPAYALASLAVTGTQNAERTAAVLAFATIAVGGLGAGFAGAAADRWGRTTDAGASMAVSGACCLLAGVVYGSSPVVLAPFALLWGVFVIADSAQFSAAVSELAEASYVGSALTLQTALGFLLTIGSIQLVPSVQGAVGWRWAFAPLAVGPLLGIGAMAWLRRLPESAALAGGRG